MLPFCTTIGRELGDICTVKRHQHQLTHSNTSFWFCLAHQRVLCLERLSPHFTRGRRGGGRKGWPDGRGIVDCDGLVVVAGVESCDGDFKLFPWLFVTSLPTRASKPVRGIRFFGDRDLDRHSVACELEMKQEFAMSASRASAVATNIKAACRIDILEGLESGVNFCRFEGASLSKSGSISVGGRRLFCSIMVNFIWNVCEVRIICR